jgi:hypothetical protein
MNDTCEYCYNIIGTDKYCYTKYNNKKYTLNVFDSEQCLINFILDTLKNDSKINIIINNKNSMIVD